MEIVIECTPQHTEWAKKAIQDSMGEAGKVFVKSLPMPANPEVATYWKH